jgi:hypothetical protein
MISVGSDIGIFLDGVRNFRQSLLSRGANA